MALINQCFIPGDLWRFVVAPVKCVVNDGSQWSVWCAVTCIERDVRLADRIAEQAVVPCFQITSNASRVRVEQDLVLVEAMPA